MVFRTLGSNGTVVGMRLLHWIVCGVLAASSAPASEADSTPKVTFASQGRLRFEHSDRTDYLSKRSAFLLRIRPDIRLSKGSDLSLFAQPQFAKAFGRPQFVGSSTSLNESQSTSGTVNDSSVGLHQAYIELRAADFLTFTLGRQLLSYGNEVVLSGLDWDNTGRSFDALKAHYAHSVGSIDLFYSKLFASSVTATTVGSGDSDLLGIYSANDLGRGLEGADAYFLFRRDQTTGVSRDLFALGIRIESRIGDWDYRAELTKEFGSAFTDPASAHQLDLETGWSFAKPFKSRLGLELFHSGSDYDQLYPLAHKYLGIADAFGRRNIQGAVIHLNGTVGKGLTAQVDVHYLLRSSTSSPAYKLNGTSALGTGANTSANIGMETDLIVNYAFSNDVTATLGGAMLIPGDYLRAELGDVTPTFWYMQWVARL